MVKIVSDTTSGLPREIADHLGIALVPQIVVFGEKSYRDDTELDTATFLQLLRASKSLPKTAAPPPLMYYPIFQEASDKGETVIVIAPSQKVSGTVRSALSARDDFPNADIRVVDTQAIAGNLGSLAIMAAKLAQEGLGADDIVSAIEKMALRGRTYFVIDTLEYLQKGGRIGGARALVGTLLQVKPILQILDGQIQPFEQERTKKRATARLMEVVEEQVKGSAEPHLCVMQVDALDEADAIRKEIGSRLGIQNIPVYELPPAIVVHAGPKTLAIGFFV